MKIYYLFLLLFITSLINAQDWKINYGDTTLTIIDYPSLFFGWNSTIPDAPLGFIGGKIFNKKIGFYASLKMSTIVPEKEWYPDLSEVTAREVLGDQQTSSRLAYVGLAAGPVVPLLNIFYLYAGLGLYSVETQYTFYDRTEILGDHGKYTLPSKSKMVAGINIGIMMWFNNKWLFNFGYSSKPEAADIGISYTF